MTEETRLERSEYVFKADLARFVYEAQARALEEAAELRVDGLYGESLHTWLYARAARIRGAKAANILADAWDEGANAGLSWDENRETDFTTPNPYRSQP